MTAIDWFFPEGAIVRASIDLGYGDLGYGDLSCIGNMAAANGEGVLTEAVWDDAIERVKDWRP